MSKLIDKGLKAKRESKHVDFKSSFNPENAGEWCELIKDVVAIANSGGGVIVVGLDNAGIPSKSDVTSLLEFDPAKIADKIRKYIGSEFSDIEVHEAKKQGETVAVLEIASVRVPLVFKEVGTYEASPGKQKTAFSRGTVYFRHGAKSEPGTTDDIRNAIERQLEAIRSEWLDGVKKVVSAPPGSAISVFSGEIRESSVPNATRIRLVDDPNAPGYRLIDHDTTYPHRQKELVDVVNAMLPEDAHVNSYDILAIRRAHNIDRDARYCHTPKFGSTQYSDDFARWIVDRHKANKDFFNEARQRFYAQTHGDN